MKRVAIAPSFEFQAAISAFLDPRHYRICTDLEAGTATAQVRGEWCAPIKSQFNYYQAALEQQVDTIILPNLLFCKYPFAVEEMKASKAFKGCTLVTINSPKLDNSPAFVWATYKALNRGLEPGVSLASFLRKLPAALLRCRMAEQVRRAYFTALPLVEVPKYLKLVYRKCQRDFLLSGSLGDAKAVRDRFLRYCGDHSVRETPEFTFLITGDFSILMTSEFPQFDVAFHLARMQCATLNPYSPTFSFFQRAFSRSSHRAMRLIDSATAPLLTHLERLTLMQVLRGVNQGVDGILFVKPVMCTPAENASTVLKRLRHLDKPCLEITYDDFCNTRALETRLESFVNIVRDKQEPPPAQPSPTPELASP